MSLPRVRFTVRRMMIAVLILGPLIIWGDHAVKITQYYDIREAALILLGEVRLAAIVLTPGVLALGDALRITRPKASSNS
jgi:hypothetical protein